MKDLRSAVYQGWVRHRRYQPREHSLRYRVFMVYLDLAELDRVFEDNRLWSQRRFSPARFRREDFLGDPALPLDVAVRRRVEAETGCYPRGAVRLLANLRYFGFQMNPICCYYCFDENEKLQYIVAEVNNTPWNERHSYVLSCNPDAAYQRILFGKQLHVSPFNPLDMSYDWRSNTPGETLRIHMDVMQQEAVAMDATLVLERREIVPHRLDWLLLQYPLMTLKVLAAIYWQALKLVCKRLPFYPNLTKPIEMGIR